MTELRTRAVFFDLDGTLADTAPDLGGALNRLLAEEGRPQLAMASLRPHVSAGTRGMLAIGFDLAPGDAAYAPLQQRFLAFYEERLCSDTRLFAGIEHLLDHLEANGILWGIVTNKPQRFTLPLARHLGLGDRAAAIVSGDSAARPKPAPDPLLLACATAGVAPWDSLYVGDDLRDIEAARAAGMRAVAAAYGYLGDGLPVAAWGADHMIADPLEILDLL